MTADSKPIEATLSLSELRDSSWDVVVIGAGVAGASAAILLARAGLKTLIVEAKKFPREKVCGGCLNQRAQDSLARIGILDALMKQGAVSLKELRLQLPRTDVIWPMPPMLSIRRSTLDSLLVHTATNAGAEFIPETQGQLVPDEPQIESEVRRVQLSNGQITIHVEATCVIVADGLTRSSLRNESGWDASVQSESRVGVQAISDRSRFTDCENHRLRMVVGKHGYVGFSVVDGGHVDIAAAIDPSFLKRLHGPENAVREILNDCGLHDLDGQQELVWLATPLLTRSSRQTAGRRVFLLGDAIGYVEPFTGEGMSWALASAEAIVPIAKSIQGSWSDQYANQWTDWVQNRSKASQQTCKLLSRCLRYPKLTAWMVFGCRWLPPLRRELMRRASQ